jgi:hypothetical protein
VIPWVRQLRPDGRNPEPFYELRSEIAHALAQLERRLDGTPVTPRVTPTPAPPRLLNGFARRCEVCDRPFFTVNSKRRLCGSPCKQEAYRRRLRARAATGALVAGSAPRSRSEAVVAGGLRAHQHRRPRRIIEPHDLPAEVLMLDRGLLKDIDRPRIRVLMVGERPHHVERLCGRHQHVEMPGVGLVLDPAPRVAIADAAEPRRQVFGIQPVAKSVHKRTTLFVGAPLEMVLQDLPIDMDPPDLPLGLAQGRHLAWFADWNAQCGIDQHGLPAEIAACVVVGSLIGGRGVVERTHVVGAPLMSQRRTRNWMAAKPGVSRIVNLFRVSRAAQTPMRLVVRGKSPRQLAMALDRPVLHGMTIDSRSTAVRRLARLLMEALNMGPKETGDDER